MKSADTRHAALNQFINFFWTILCFAPVLWFWITTGTNPYFYLLLIISLMMGIMPQKILNLFLISPERKFYEKIGVKHIRKFVQNGDIVASMTGSRSRQVIKGASQVRGYLKTIAMYERYHWICFVFFLLTSVYCFFTGYIKFGVEIIAANLLYNVSSILLQQYNKIRITKMIVKP